MAARGDPWNLRGRSSSSAAVRHGRPQAMSGKAAGMRVCIVSHYSEMGGAERALLETGEALRRFGISCFVILPRAGALCPELHKRGIPFRIFPYGWWAGRRGTPLWRKLKDLFLTAAAVVPVALEIRRRRCDLVITNTITICVGAFAAWCARRPHVWFIHEFFGTEENDLFFYLGGRFSLAVMDRLSALCVANSLTTAQTYRQGLARVDLKAVYQSVTPGYTDAVSAGDSKAGNVPPCAAPAKGPSLQNAKKPFSCVLVGTLCPLKGQMDAVRAVAELAREGEEVTLDLIGGGDPEYAAYLRKMALRYGIGRQVRFHGAVPDAFLFLAAADAVLICSRSESFGRATVEAMLAGKPVIGARRGATGELIGEGFNGLLYEPGDWPGLADKIRFLREKTDAARCLGDNGKAWARDTFSTERYGKQLSEIFMALLGSPHGKNTAWRSGA